MNAPPFDRSIFINCPFDDDYKPLFHAMVFTCQACKFFSRCALEFEGDPLRIKRIIDLIRDCQFGIHDVSIPDSRLNMPLELGLFLGCQSYGDTKQQTKSYLILEAVPFSSNQYLSDLAGVDPKAHRNDTEMLIECVREWLVSKSKDSKTVPHSPYICDSYRRFRQDLPETCEKLKWTPDKLLFPEYLTLVDTWIADNF